MNKPTLHPNLIRGTGDWPEDDAMKKLTKEQKEWIESRPPHVQEVIKKYPPWKAYRLKGSPTFPATLYSYDECEDGTVKVKVDIHNPLFTRRVFGVNPSDLKAYEKE